MKKPILSLAFISLLMWGTTAYATFVSGSTGALGAFNPTANTVVALPTDGVLNYTTINVPAGVTVSFQQNATDTPVYMLATGDVVIAGTISVNGSNGTSTIPGSGGPGGFGGGYGGANSVDGGKGLGPGGGCAGSYTSSHNGCGGSFSMIGNGGYNSTPDASGVTYGNARLLPLIGGSGGGGGSGSTSYSGSPGGGGGGAIVIASSSSISVSGLVTANAGSSYILSGNNYSGGGGSGGSIKLVSNIVSGNGTITAIGGNGSLYGGVGGIGSYGRIRIEATTNNRTAQTNPPYYYGLPSSIFVSNPPSLKITSIAGTATPATTTGSYSQPDLLLPNTTTNPVAVNVSATNIPDGTTVTVGVIPQFGNPTSVNTTLSGSSATASINLSTTYSTIVTAQATFTMVGMYYNGEEIDKVRVAATMGGKSETTYLTRSGKEIKGELVAALMK
jgi:hypothetical protein